MTTMTRWIWLAVSIGLGGCAGSVDEIERLAQAEALPACSCWTGELAGQVAVEESSSSEMVRLTIDGKAVCQGTFAQLASSGLLDVAGEEWSFGGGALRSYAMPAGGEAASDPMPGRGGDPAASDPMPGHGGDPAASDPMPGRGNRLQDGWTPQLSIVTLAVNR